MPSDYKGHYGDDFGRDDPKLGKSSFDKPFLNIVRETDPNLDRDRKREIEYEMSNGRKFRGDPSKRGPYD